MMKPTSVVTGVKYVRAIDKQNDTRLDRDDRNGKLVHLGTGIFHAYKLAGNRFGKNASVSHMIDADGLRPSG